MLVIDACFAIDVVRGGIMREPFLEELAKGEEVIVPDIYYSEVANALWQIMRAGMYDIEDATAKMEEALSFVGSTVSGNQLAPEVLAMAQKRNHPVYDMFYLVLARRHNATLCTLDKKLQTLCIKEGISLVCPIDLD